MIGDADEAAEMALPGDDAEPAATSAKAESGPILGEIEEPATPVEITDAELEPLATGTGRGPAATDADRPSPTPATPPALLDEIAGLGDRLGRRIDALQALLERDARAEATRERVIDRLHAELQEYKQDLLLKVQRPIFIDLIQLHDDIGKMIEARPAGHDDLGRAAAVRGILESIQVAIEDILYRQGVEPFAAEGAGFDPRRQRAIATVATDDPGMNKTIAARVRKGFQAGDKLIRPEIVSVYTLRAP